MTPVETGPIEVGDLMRSIEEQIAIVELLYEYVYNQYVQLRVIHGGKTDNAGQVLRIPLSYVRAYWRVVA